MTTWQQIYDQLNIDPAWDRRVYRVAAQKGVFDMIAYHSSMLEGYDQWDMHARALQKAYAHGRAKKPLTMYEFLSWHGAILPYGGSLRTCEALPNLGFSPTPVSILTLTVNQFVKGWNARLNGDPFLSLATLHMDEYTIHPWPDANKRHCRMLTIYGCGWYGLDPVCILLSDKRVYLDALSQGNIHGLAQLFEQRTISQ